MIPTDDPQRAWIALVDLAEMSYPYVSLARLRALARAEGTPSTHGLARWIREALARGVLLSDSRLRVRRDGELEPVQIYRLNRTHPVVDEALRDS